MDEKKAREIRQEIFNGNFKCISVSCGGCTSWKCNNCPACMAAHQYFELFGDNGSQVPEGDEGYK